MNIIQLTDSGIVTTSRNNIFNSLMAKFKTIYGDNTSISKGTEDYNMISLLADVLSDMSNTAVSVENALSLTNAVGTQLDNLAALYYGDFTRKSATATTVQVTITGTANTTIANGKVRDSLGGIWSLPTTVTIPTGGTTNVVATYTETGDYFISNGSISGSSCIATPISGWTNVTQIDDTVTLGRSVESDADFRVRIAQRSKGTARGTLETLAANIAQIEDVTQVKIYENDTSDSKAVRTDLTISSHTIAPVIYGTADLDQDNLAQVIYNYKSSGVGTQGTTTKTVTSTYAQNVPINFTIAGTQTIMVDLTLKKLSSTSFALTDEVESALKTAIETQMATYEIGDTIYAQDFYLPVISTLNTMVGTNQYNISSLTVDEATSEVMAWNIKAITDDAAIEIVTE